MPDINTEAGTSTAAVTEPVRPVRQLPKHPPKKKGGCLSKLLKFIIFLVILAGLCYGGYRWVLHTWEPAGSADSPAITVTVDSGESVSYTAQSLQNRNIIQNAKTFVLYCYLNQITNKIQAGVYNISSGSSVPEICEMLTTGKTASVRITIPEGYTVAQIGDELIQAGLVTEEDWNAAKERNYDRDYLMVNQKNGTKEVLEGYLFPDTYDFTEGMTAEEIIEVMLSRFDEVWDSIIHGSEVYNYSKNDVVTIASLIERECQAGSERERIAGVIYNRLKADMPLQIDASVLYAMGKVTTDITYADLKTQSPYNTYVVKGLPVGPIANPGMACLNAALHPEKNSYLYYVAKGDGSGTHAFSETYEEQLANEAQYQGN